MSLSSWLSSTFSRSHARRAKRRNPASRLKTARPCLEHLETRVTPSLSYLSTLVSFAAANGSGIRGAIVDSSGNLYSTTTYGGANGDGSVFEIAKGSGTITTLASFNGTNGNGPEYGMILDSSGNLYGVTGYGGANGDGTVFELANGSSTITALASFNGSNGRLPDGGLVMDGSGNLYGTTAWGGANTSSYFPNGAGVVFELAKGSGTITALASFNGSNGYRPQDGLIVDSSGNLYGTTPYGGAGLGSTSYAIGEGTVFEVAAGSGAITTLASFNGTNGARPLNGRMVMDGSGNLYGETNRGGPAWNPQHGNDGYGTVFELAKGSGAITALASFNVTNGASPGGGPVMDSSGNLFGTTFGGGPGGSGTVYELAKGSAAITTLAAFNGSNGSGPTSSLAMDSSGNLYGTTGNGGANGYGTVFEVTNGPSFAITGPSSVTAGTAGTFTLTALNADGTINTGYSGTVQITSTDPKAVLPSNLAISGGTGTFNVTLKTAGAQSITATDVNNSSMIGFDIGVVVNPAAASQFILSSPSSVTHGVAFSMTLTVEDAYGNVVTGYTGTVHFTSSDGTATLPVNYTFTAGDAGVHTFTNNTILRKRGTKTITVTDTLNKALTTTDQVTVN